MSIFDSIIYGIIQGLTEFLPVSSSAHLALLPYVLKIDDPGVFFDLSMHLGTALAVIFYYRRELWQLLPRSWNLKQWPPLIFNLGVSCLATFIPALIFKDYAEDWGRRPLNIAVNLIVFALLFWWADRRQQQQVNGNGQAPQFDRHLLWQAAVLMGLAQFIAIFPGVSRSGITLTMGLILGMSRERAVNYSFLMGLPVILGGFVFKLRDVQGSIDWAPVLVGAATSMIVGILAIVLFLRLLKRFGAMPFLVYRLLIGLVLIYLSF